MAKVFNLRRGLDINLKGKAERKLIGLKPNGHYMLRPADFHGITPKPVVKEGDRVKAGDALFVNKDCPDVKFSSPVSGVVASVLRGERRKLLGVKVDADNVQESVSFGVKDVAALTAGEVRTSLLEAGIFGYINQLPYAVSADPSSEPKAIFVSALRDKPLAADFEYELEGQEKDFQTGLTALSRIARTFLGIGGKQTASALTCAKDVEINVFNGPCPAGNVGVQVNHISPVNKGETVWTVEPTVVLFIGRLFNTGHVDLHRRVAFAGSEVRKPAYVDMLVGQELATLLCNSISDESKVRIIDGNVLTGVPTDKNGYLGAHTSEITVIPEGDNADEFAGWIMPRFRQFSMSRTYFSWLMPKREYVLDARVKGGSRHIIMSGEYDKVIPMDIYAEYLIKAIIAGDIDRMEQLGIYEVAPEDFALAEFVDSSKLELQRIVREGLDMLRKENG
ncbi:Na(+)-translocating NADH-quinone reductase subunit A [Xylanibacter muris]|uniref:Na(+)-translocating NADH-quinone reductase subunit A n=1 Tax=Xylanibacter muris TaxID=2736290 RepID=A0ABX2AKD0_9BACT|nr:Na(+)-translocating NADH-quinone reductase subunit A [Xylanibacter muris]NPD91494.1 Na(+)-translocating NADH-quinone reductase subunit A [Xylanibacter muris]